MEEGEWDHLRRLKHQAEDLIRTIFLKGDNAGEEDSLWRVFKSQDAAAFILTISWHATLRYSPARINAREAMTLYRDYREKNTQKRRDNKTGRTENDNAMYVRESSAETASVTEWPMTGTSTSRMNALIRNARRQCDSDFDLEVFGDQWNRLPRGLSQEADIEETEISDNISNVRLQEQSEQGMHSSLAVFDTFQAYEDLRLELCARRFERAFITEGSQMAEQAYDIRNKSWEELAEQYLGENTTRLKELTWKMTQDFPPVFELIKWRFEFERDEI